MSELEKIQCKFADSMFEIYTQKRFGLKSCRPRVQVEDIYDILNLYLNSLTVDGCGLCPDCDLQTMNEKINTL